MSFLRTKINFIYSFHPNVPIWSITSFVSAPMAVISNHLISQQGHKD